MITALARFIDRTTMYKLVLYYVALLLLAALALSALGFMGFSFGALAFSAVVVIAASWLVHEAAAWFMRVAPNDDSWLITALIIVLLLPPVAFTNAWGAADLAFVAALGVVSKYVLTYRGKHLFNPAALAVALGAWLVPVSATWWVAGNLPLLPFVLLGLALPYKIRRFDVVLPFFAVAFLATVALAPDTFAGVQALVLHSAVFFLAFAMLTEPLTMPPTRGYRLWYGALVGLLFAPFTHLGSFFFSPEEALLTGNLFSFFVSPKRRYRMALLGRTRIADGIYEFAFRSDRPLTHRAGQYAEWTIGGVPFDLRGNRRYFTIASAPGDDLVRLGVRFYDAPSAFKRRLAELRAGDVVFLNTIAGDFTLPADPKHKLAFIAGGVGVTPFASMVRAMITRGESRDTVLLYASKRAAEIAYADVFEQARANGLRTTYVLSDEDAPRARHGFVDAALITEEIPDYAERTFYVSGPPGMVHAMKKALRVLQVPRSRIKTDYFSGLA